MATIFAVSATVPAPSATTTDAPLTKEQAFKTFSLVQVAFFGKLYVQKVTLFSLSKFEIIGRNFSLGVGEVKMKTLLYCLICWENFLIASFQKLHCSLSYHYDNTCLFAKNREKKGKRYIKGKTKFVLPNEQKDVEYL